MQLQCQRRLQRLWELGMPVLPRPRSSLQAPAQHPAQALEPSQDAAAREDAAELLLRSGSAERPRCAAWVGLDEGQLGRSEQFIAAAVQGDLGRMAYLLLQARQIMTLLPLTVS